MSFLRSLESYRDHEAIEAEGLAKDFLSELPGLYRVGTLGRNLVWERRTRWKEGDIDEFLVQRLHETGVPSFYDTGVPLPPLNQDEHDKRPSVKDVLGLLRDL